MLKRTAILMFALIACLPLWGCSSEPSAPTPERIVTVDQAQTQNAPAGLPGPSSTAADATRQALEKAAIVQKQMIYTADLRLTVKDYKQVLAEMEQIAEKRGAYLVSSSESRTAELYSASLTWRVPAGEFSAMVKEIGRLRTLSPPETKIHGTDVSEELVDLESRLKAKQAAETRLLQMMKQAADAKSLLEISREIDAVQSEIEQLKGRIRYLNHHVSYSTVNVRIEQPIVPQASEERPLLDQMATAFKTSVSMIGVFLEQLLIFLAALLPVLLLLAVPAVLALQVWKRRNKRVPPMSP